MALINTTTTGVLGTTVYGDGAGALTVQKDGVTQGIYGNIPAFRAYLSGNQTVSNGTSVKVQLNGKTFDTANCFDTTTNYRYTPNVAGYYNISIMGGASGSSALSYNYIQIWKNGSRTSFAIYGPYATSYQYGTLTNLIYMNGTTDYIEMYTEIAGTGTMTCIGDSTGGATFMSGFLVKAT